MTIIESHNLNLCLKKHESCSIFKTNFLKFIRPFSNSVCNCHNPREICLITRLRLGLSHLRECKLKHSFRYTSNALCSCAIDLESTEHFLLHCPQFFNEKRTLSLLESNVLTQTLLFGNMPLSRRDNSKILNAAIDFILSTERFDEQLFEIMKVQSTYPKQANNLTSLITCFLSNRNFFSLCYVKTIIIFDLFLFRKFTFFLINPSHSLYILGI